MSAELDRQLPAHRLDRVKRDLEAAEVNAPRRIGRSAEREDAPPDAWRIMCRAGGAPVRNVVFTACRPGWT